MRIDKYDEGWYIVKGGIGEKFGSIKRKERKLNPAVFELDRTFRISNNLVYLSKLAIPQYMLDRLGKKDGSKLRFKLEFVDDFLFIDKNKDINERIKQKYKLREKRGDEEK